MFRRRRPTTPTSPTGPVPIAGSAPDPQVGPLADRLAEQGWILPRGLDPGAGARWTLVGTVGSPTATAVDPAGLVVADGWSLDWWIGADDRWHLPARTASVRQQLLDGVPVVETLARIPGGEAVHRAYGIRSPRPGGDEWVVAEIENRTSIPFAAVLLVRPVMANAVGSIGTITIEAVAGGSGTSTAHLIRVDGRAAVVLPRRPARVAVGNAATGDLEGIVTSGAAGSELVAATCPEGLATMALVFPLAHTAVLRAALPVGAVDEAAGPLGFPAVLPEASVVASGWDVHRRGPRLEVPDQRLATSAAAARGHLQLALDGESVRRDGRRAPDLEPGATEVVLGALDLLDRPADVGSVVARWTDRLADPAPPVDALFLDVIARHWLLHRVDALLDWLLPEVAAAVERLDRADRRSRLTDPVDRHRAAVAVDAAADLLGRAGQAGAVPSVRSLADRLRVGAIAPTAEVADRLLGVAAALAAGDQGALAALDVELTARTTTSTWPGPGRDGRRIGHDLAASAAVVHVARAMLVAERPDGLALLPVFGPHWYGGGLELHDAPTAWGVLSYAVRWHGTRPALLWELVPHPGTPAAVLRIPGLDPTWSTTELRGDALLAEVTPPEGLDLLRVVAEHPDVDPAMRPAGEDPLDLPTRLPDGGSFS